MSKQIQDAYIVAAARTPVGKVRGAFRNTRPTICWRMCCAAWSPNVRGWTRS
jgi:acetyl-CoA acetyltransferase